MCTFSDHTYSSTRVFYIALHGATINIFFWTSFFLFLQTYLLINLIFDTLIFCNLLVNLFSSFCLFLVLLRMLWILLTSRKPFHVPLALRITTRGVFFLWKYHLICPRKFRCWSHAFLVTNHKMFFKRLLTVRPTN